MFSFQRLGDAVPLSLASVFYKKSDKCVQLFQLCSKPFLSGCRPGLLVALAFQRIHWGEQKSSVSQSGCHWASCGSCGSFSLIHFPTSFKWLRVVVASRVCALVRCRGPAASTPFRNCGKSPHALYRSTQDCVLCSPVICLFLGHKRELRWHSLPPA